MKTFPYNFDSYQFNQEIIKIRQKKRLSNKFSELDEFKLTTETLHLGTLLIDCVIKSGVNIIQQKVNILCIFTKISFAVPSISSFIV